MSSEIITKNDLKAILDTALPTQPVLSDTGWLEPTFTSAFRNYPDAGQYVKYRRVGKIVEIRGAAQPTAEIAGSDTTVTIFTLPLGFRPETRLVRIMQGSGACIWLMTIEPSGEVGFVRYRNGATYTAAADSVWLAMSTTFTVENDDWPVTPVTTADYVVEQGTSGIWTYRKWNSGISECWGKYTQTITSGGSVLGGYYYSSNAIPYPTNLFIEEPNVQYSGRVGSGYCLCGTLYNASASSVQMWVVSQVNGTQDCTFFIRAEGKWK